jgi:predicted GNAT family N-acyltransferase
MGSPRYTVQELPVERTLALRKAVLRPHLLESEVFELADDRDPTTVAFGAVTPEDEVIAVARISPEPPPFDQRASAAWRLRGMAASPGVRNAGVGTAVLQRVIDRVAASGGGILWANARLGARSLYERAGMQPWGEEWEEPDIGPHIVMWRDVAAAG